MDPLAIQLGSLQSVRPVLALDGSLTSILREGRMVAGEVLQRMDGGTVLIGLGRHRVPADSQVEMQPGQRFLARVVEGEEGLVLKVLGPGGGKDSKLLLALRSVVGQDRPVGELLGEVAGRLRAALGAGAGRTEGDRGLGELLQKIGEHVFVPGMRGADLRQLIARSGFDYEALLFAEAQGGRGVLQLQRGLAALVRQLLGELDGRLAKNGLNLTPTQLDDLRQRFLRALRGLGDLAPELQAEGAAVRLRQELTARLERALEGGPGGRAREALKGALPQVLGVLLDGDGPALTRLLRLLSSSSAPADLARDLKAQLLGALAELPEGAARDSVARALAGVESEQLLNLARREFHEGWHLSLPVPDGERWATAHLFYADPDDADDCSEGEEMQRMTVSVDFSQLGPLRAEIGVRQDLIALRLVVTRPEVVEELHRALRTLTDQLELGGRKTRVAIALGRPEEADADSLGFDIRWLREHRLMDLRG